jgi:integrase/recombinase XerD
MQKALIEIMYSTGCRVSEIESLNKGNVNWDKRTIKVVGKGDKERIVCFTYRAKMYLERYLNERVDGNEALFIKTKGIPDRFKVRAIQKLVKVIAKRACIQRNVHPHVFRHTLATTLINNGASIHMVQLLLGHSNPDTTMEYAQMDESTKIKDYQKFMVQ